MFFQPTSRGPWLRLTAVTPTSPPAFELRVALRAADGQVHVRTRLCWAEIPSSATVLDVLLRRTAEAKRQGLTLVVEQAPAELCPLMLMTGLGDLLVRELAG